MLEAEVDRVDLRLHTHNYNHLGEQVTNTEASYVRLHKNLESLTQTHRIPYVGPLGEIMGKDVIMQELKDFIEQIK